MKTPGFKISRRRFLGGVSFAAAGTLGYARFIEAERLQTSRITVPISNGVRTPLKLLHLSDLHASGAVSLSYLDGAMTRALAWKPDVICVTGDFITRRFDNAADYARILRRLAEAAPCYASLGNHDGGRWAGEHGGHSDLEWISGLLRQSGITLLHNTAAHLAVRDWPLNLVGIGDLWSAQFDPPAGFRHAREGSPTILLSHNPDTKTALLRHRWDLMLCGHTHGGQLRLPLLGTPFAPVEDKRFVDGLHRWNERWIHITKGVGSLYGLRINCPPEVSCLTLT